MRKNIAQECVADLALARNDNIFTWLGSKQVEYGFCLTGAPSHRLSRMSPIRLRGALSVSKRQPRFPGLRGIAERRRTLVAPS